MNPFSRFWSISHPSSNQKPNQIVQTLLSLCCLLGLVPNPATAQEEINPTLQIGVVQHFGEKPTDQLFVSAPPGDHLILRFKTPEGEKVLHTLSVILKVGLEPLAEPQAEERIVLSSHRSFESAEESANQWRQQGIAVEIAQPLRWEVWAKRSVYSTPLLRRWLLESLQAQGHQLPHLQTQVLKQQRVPYWVLAGYRYNRHELDISTTQNLIQVSPKKDDPNPSLYPGSLRLQPNAYGSYTLVNQVSLETYLRGVVPHEIGAWPPDASIEAQAVLARTYALRNLRRFAVDNYQLCASTDCQVYKGLTEVYPTTDQAIAVTRGLVLTYNGELIDAVYSALSGGITANFDDVWNGTPRPYLKAIVDAPGKVWDLNANTLANEQNFRRFMNLQKGFNEEGWPDFRWREETTLEAIAANLKLYLQRRNHPQANFKSVYQLQVSERSATGRILKMTVQTDQGPIEIKKDEIQTAFIPPISTLFYIDPVFNPNKTLKGYVFVGGGFGHGVGMSQTGSYKLAKLGWTSDRILSFYFPGTQLQPLNNSIIFWRESL